MNSITQVIKLAFFILALTVGIASAVFLVKNSLNDPVAMHGDSTNDPKGVYEIYNDTIVTGEQVLTAQIVYGNYDQTEPNKGLCRIQTGKTRALFENNEGPEWSDYREVKQKDADSWVNPEGLFQANLVYGKDLPNTQDNEIIRLNYANVLQWIEFRQIPPKETNKPDVTAALATPEPEILEQEFIPTSPEVTHLVAQGTMNLWEGTKITDITPSKQGVTIKYGDEDVTDEVNWPDWNPTITNGSTKQEKSCTVQYGEKTVVVKVTFYKALDVAVSTNDAVDGHPVRVTINHPEEATNSFDTTNWDYNFRFTQSDETKQPELFEILCKKGVGSVPLMGGYVVANTTSGGANTLTATVSASMTVGVAEQKYVAARKDSEIIKWAPFTVTYFNQTADEAYKNSGNYTDEMTGLIAGATDANAGTTSLIAAGDVITLKCNTAARYDYKGAGLLEKLLAAILNNQIFAQPEASEDYTAGTGTTTALALQAARATNAGEATVTFTDVVTGFERTQEDKYCRIYSAFDFTIPSYNLDKDEAIVRDEEQAQQYQYTDLVVTGSKSLTTTNDKKMYVEQSTSVNDNGVMVHDWVYGTFSKAASLDAEETAAAENGVSNNYTLDCKTQWDGKHVSTNRQGRETFTAVYPDFGSRYTKEKIVFVWYPLTVEFTRPLDKDNEVQDSGYVGEPVIMTVSQNNDVTYTLDDGNATEELLVKSEAVNGEIKAKDCNFYKEFNGLSYDGVDVTRTFSSGSVAYTLNKAGTVTYSVNRARTGEKVEKGTSVFTDCNPGDLMNATSNGSDEALAVTDGENRVANGDSIYFNNSDNTGTMSVKNVTFDVLTWKGINHNSLSDVASGRLPNIPTNATTVATCGNGTLKVEKGYEKLITLDKNGINFSFNNAHSRDFYLMQAKARQFKFDFADEKKTAFAVTGGKSALYGVYRFDDNVVEGTTTASNVSNNGIDGLIGGFSSNNTTETSPYKWCHAEDEVALFSIYKTDYRVGAGYSSNVTMAYGGIKYKDSNGVVVKQMLGDRRSDAKNDDKSPNEQKLTIATIEGSIAGTKTSVTMTHPQFNNRTKTLTWKTFSDISEEVDVVEMHEATVKLGAGAEDNLLLKNLDDDKFDTTNKKISDESKESTNNTDRLQQVSLSSKKLKLITKQSGDKTINYSVKNKLNGEEYPIKVNVHNFKVKVYNAFRDNRGYKWEANGKYSTEKIVLTPTDHTYIGDTLAVTANSENYIAEVASDDKDEIQIAEIKKDPIKTTKFTTRTKAANDTKAYLFDEYFYNEKYTEGSYDVKFYSTCSTNDKVPANLETNDEEYVKKICPEIIVTDKGISSYWKDEQNYDNVVVKFTSQPVLWFVTNLSYFKSCKNTECANDGYGNIPHPHIGSRAFTELAYQHGLTYSMNGAAPLGSTNAEIKTGSYKDKEITYLNLSHLSTDGPTDFVNEDTWIYTPGKISYTGEAISETVNGFSLQFPTNKDKANSGHKQGDYVYMQIYGFGGHNQPFIVSYSKDKENWSYIGKKGEIHKNITSMDDLKNCMFSFNPASKLDDMVRYGDEILKNPVSEKMFNKSIKDGTSKKVTLLKVTKLKDFLPDHTNGFSWYNDNGGAMPIYSSTGEDVSTLWVAAINAKELGWLNNSITYIRFTFVNPNQLNRSFTYQIEFHPKDEKILDTIASLGGN